MALYPYVATLAVDPVTLMAAKGATGTIHPPEDSQFASPLTATDATGNPIPLTANADGILPSFYATVPAVNWRSGSYVFPLVTSQPLEGPKGDTGTPGPPGRDAPAVGNAVLTRDAEGRITSSIEDGFTVTYTRDTEGRIKTETRNGKTTTYTRDADGRVSGWSTN